MLLRPEIVALPTILPPVEELCVDSMSSLWLRITFQSPSIKLWMRGLLPKFEMREDPWQLAPTHPPIRPVASPRRLRPSTVAGLTSPRASSNVGITSICCTGVETRIPSV